MDTLTHGRPSSMISKDTVSSTPSSSSGTALMPILSKLSQSASGSSGLSHETEAAGYTAKTVRLVTRGTKEVWRRSGMGFIFPGTSKPVPVQPPTGRATLDVSTIVYPTLRSHPPPEAHPILLLTLSNIHNVSPLITNDELFDVSLRKLEPWVGDEGDGGYVLVVLAADDGRMSSGRSWPSVGWWVWKWRRIPRKYRKNLKRLYIVHPSLFTRTLVPLFARLVSPKSHPKLHPLPSLLSLARHHGVSLSGMLLPLCVLHEEARVMRDRPDKFPHARTGRHRYPVPDIETSSTWSGTISSTWTYAASYLPFSRSEDASVSTDADDVKKGLWGNSIENIVAESGGIPRLLVELGKVIMDECTTTEGIFRRTSSSHLFDPILELLCLPVFDQPTLPWSEIAKEDPLLPPKILLRFLSDLDGPLVPSSIYHTIKRTTSPESVPSFLSSLPRPNRLIIEWLVPFMRELSAHELSTRMSPLALSIVLAPSLINGSDPIADAEMCLPPGKTLPAAMVGRERTADEGSGTLVGLLEMWIKQEEK